MLAQMTLSRSAIIRAANRTALSSIAEIAGRATNTFLPIAVLWVHGADEYTDSFFFLLALAFFVQGTVANGLLTASVAAARDGGEQFSLARITYYGAPACALLALISLQVSPADASTSWQVCSMIFIAVSAGSGLLAAPAAAALNIEHKYVAPGLTWAFRIAPVATYLWHKPSSSTALCLLLVGICITDFARTLLLLRLARRRLTFASRGRSNTVTRNASQLVVGSAIVGLIPLVCRSFAAALGPGAVTIFELADRIYSMVASVSTIGVGQVVLVYLSRLAGGSADRAPWRIILTACTGWAVLVFAIGLCLYFAFPLIGHFARAMDTDDIQQAQAVYLVLVFSLPAVVFNVVLSRRILTTQTALPLLKIGIASLVTTSLVCFAATPGYSIIGIALAAVVSQIAATAWMIVTLTKRDRSRITLP